MTNRELLELAAKANWASDLDDMSLRWCDKEQCILYIHADNQDHNGIDRELPWRPLDDDTDALRMALKLGICIQPIPQCDTVQVYQEREFTAEPFNVHVAGLGDIELRLIITQAAAEIGKATK